MDRIFLSNIILQGQCNGLGVAGNEKVDCGSWISGVLCHNFIANQVQTEKAKRNRAGLFC